MLRMLSVWVLDDTSARYLIEAEVTFQRKRKLQLQSALNNWAYDDTRVWRTRRAVYVLWLEEAELMLDWLAGLLQALENPAMPVPAVFDRAMTTRGSGH
jgi:hypothetical protein